jgi:hypothetical protein
MQTFFKIILGAVLMLALPACSDFLQLSPTSVVTEKVFYQTQQDMEQATVAVYDPLTWGGLYNGTLWGIGDIMSDNCITGGGGGGDGQEFIDMDNFTHNSNNPQFALLWDAAYVGISRANIVIEKAPNPAIAMAASVRAQLIAEAKFLRAHYYFTLVRLFGPVPLHVVPTTITTARRPRDPESVVYAQIEQDLTDAAAVLPLAAAEAGRATRGAANGLLAKVYLTQRKMTQAAAAANTVMASNLYQLRADYGESFDPATENNNEVLFAAQFETEGAPFSDFGEGSRMSTFFAPRLQNLVTDRGYGFNIPTSEIIALYQSGDTRRAVSVLVPGDQVGSYTQPASLPGSPNGFNVHKYFVPPSQDYGWTSPTNFPILRYADVLLMHAEAVGPTPEGYNSLNQVRRRAFNRPLNAVSPNDAPPGMNAADFTAYVLRERRIELAFEQERWHDLIRQPGDFFVTVMRAHGKTQIQNFHRYLPIPLDEVQISGGAIQQNPGY